MGTGPLGAATTPPLDGVLVGPATPFIIMRADYGEGLTVKLRVVTIAVRVQSTQPLHGAVF